MAETQRRRKPSRPSSITQLDPGIKDAVDKAIREGRLTIDEIVALIEASGGDASRSAVGRYVKTQKERLEELREAQGIASVWVEKLGEDPQGDVSRLVIEMLRMVAYRSVRDIDIAGPEDLMFLGKALKDIAGADKLVVDREINLRKLIAAKAEKVAGEIVKEAKRQGVSDETLQVWREKVLGVAQK